MSSNDLANQMAADAGGDSTPENEKLSELSTLVVKLKEIDAKIDGQEDYLKMLKEQQRELSMQKIPDLFDEMQLSNIKMKDGSVVEVKREFAASIKVDNKPFCFEWLRKNGHESIIKHDVTVKLKKGEESASKELIAQIEALGMTYTDKEHVHPMTLKAFVKEQITNGADLPQEEFGVFPIRKTKIK